MDDGLDVAARESAVLRCRNLGAFTVRWPRFSLFSHLIRENPDLPSMASVSIALCCGVWLISTHAVRAQEVWMMPPADGSSIRQLFDHPEQWTKTRSYAGVLGYPDHLLNAQFNDKELGNWLPQLKHLRLKLGLEVGAIKPWSKTGANTFDVERPMWERFSSLGGEIYAIAMDEPLAATQEAWHESMNYAVQETATFIQLVRKRYPDVLIGDIEPYPSFSADELVIFIDSLQARLKQLHVKGLDFFRLDVDWMNFVSERKGGWIEVKSLEDACRQRLIPFGLIYWAADYPKLNHMKLADDSTWYVSVMQQGYDYASVGGAPDQYIIESWVGAPTHTLPETREWTFTKSVLDFGRKFVATRR